MWHGSMMIRSPARLILLALAALTATPLHAQDMAPAPVHEAELEVGLSADGSTIYLVGSIREGAFHQFDAVLRKAPRARRVHLSSIGGLTLEARLIAALVRKRKLDTHVEYLCASACTQIFAAGRNRVIGPWARLGFHQSARIDPQGYAAPPDPQGAGPIRSTTVFGISGNQTLRLAYELAGVEPRFIARALSFENVNMWLPEPDELIAAGMVTAKADTAEPSPRADHSVDRDAFRQQLLGQPLWRAGFARLPEMTEAALDDAWRSANSGFTREEAILAARSSLVSEAMLSLPAAPDAVLERALVLHAQAARIQRTRGYPMCLVRPDSEPPPPGPADRAYQDSEDALLADFLMNTERVLPMNKAEGKRQFAREVAPRLAPPQFDGDDAAEGGDCRLGFQILEVIEALPRKKRIKAYRALLALDD